MAQGDKGEKGLIMLGGLWVQTAKGGRKYLAGRLGLGGKLMVFKNDKKGKATDPDYNVVLGEWIQSEADATRTTRGRNDDDVPF